MQQPNQAAAPPLQRPPPTLLQNRGKRRTPARHSSPLNASICTRFHTHDDSDAFCTAGASGSCRQAAEDGRRPATHDRSLGLLASMVSQQLRAALLLETSWHTASNTYWLLVRGVPVAARAQWSCPASSSRPPCMLLWYRAHRRGQHRGKQLTPMQMLCSNVGTASFSRGGPHENR